MLKRSALLVCRDVALCRLSGDRIEIAGTERLLLALTLEESLLIFMDYGCGTCGSCGCSGDIVPMSEGKRRGSVWWRRRVAVVEGNSLENVLMWRHVGRVVQRMGVGVNPLDNNVLAVDRWGSTVPRRGVFVCRWSRNKNGLSGA